jgi:hypothetical protein
MDAPVNIVVESRDGKSAELVGRAISQSLKDTYGFKRVTVGHVVADTPGFRAWHSSTEVQEEPQSLLEAMQEANPQLFEQPVTIISREQPLKAFSDPVAEVSGFVEAMNDEGVTFAEAQGLQDVTFKLPGEPAKPAQADVEGFVKAAEMLGIRVEKVISL